MDSLVLQLGVGGIFAILLIDRALKFARDYSAANKPASAVPEAVKDTRTGPLPIIGATPNPDSDRKISDVHEIISLKDEDGVPRVYVSRSIQRIQEETVSIVRELEDTSEKTLATLERMNGVLTRLDKSSQDMAASVDRNTRVLSQVRDALTDIQNKPRTIDSGVHPAAERRHA